MAQNSLKRIFSNQSPSIRRIFLEIIHPRGILLKQQQQWLLLQQLFSVKLRDPSSVPSVLKEKRPHTPPQRPAMKLYSWLQAKQAVYRQMLIKQ
jgi:hypothetical protein